MRVGKSYLAKRKFNKFEVKEENGIKQESRFSGAARVVVTSNTPITLSYYTRTQKLATSFWTQRYNENMEAMDALVQAKLNGS